MPKVIVAGIGTGVGKTICSAILADTLQADYWKPISCAKKGEEDRLVVERLLSKRTLKCHDEAYCFFDPLSPHAAAELANTHIETNKIRPPKCNRLIIEMIGGILVPLNHSECTLDLYQKWEATWVLVASNYLGSINHTLLTVEALRKRNIEPLGIIFNGTKNLSSEKAIMELTHLPVVGRVDQEPQIQPQTIRKYSKLWTTQKPWKELQN